MHEENAEDHTYFTISIDRVTELANHERAALQELRDAVYPLELEAAWSGAYMEWSAPLWRLRLWDSAGVLACQLGILLRTGTYNGNVVTIAGVGGVSTHPQYRGRGYAAKAMQAAEKFFHDCGDIDFGLLVCDQPLLDYYAKFGWQEFRGQLLITQFGERSEFTYSRIMTLPVHCAAPIIGKIDLAGPPW